MRRLLGESDGLWIRRLLQLRRPYPPSLTARPTSAASVLRGLSSPRNGLTGRNWLIERRSDSLSATRLRLRQDLVAEPGRQLVILPGDGLVELLAQGLFHRELLADILFVDAELIDQVGIGRVGRVVLLPEGALMVGQALNPVADGIDRLFGAVPLKCELESRPACD